jgi:hypothetical protein
MDNVGNSLAGCLCRGQIPLSIHPQFLRESEERTL